MSALAVLSLALALVGHPHGVPPDAPPEVAACIRAGAVFVAQPDYFEELTFTRDHGVVEKAYQILDHHDGRTGHLLLFPSSCHVAVLTHDGALYPTGDVRERAMLFRWARFAPFDEKNPAHAAWRVGDATSVAPRWLPGRPVPQESAWRDHGGEVHIERLARFAHPIAWDASGTGLALYVYAGGAHEAALAVYDSRDERFAIFAAVDVRAVDAASIIRVGDTVRVVDARGQQRMLRLPAAAGAPAQQRSRNGTAAGEP